MSHDEEMDSLRSIVRITASFECGGCKGTLVPGKDLTYGYRCTCGWVLLPAPRFSSRWITLVPASVGRHARPERVCHVLCDYPIGRHSSKCVT